MTRNVGLWIDRRKAIIVTIDDNREELKVLDSGIDPRVRVAGGSRSRTPYGPQEAVSERTRDERFRAALRAYCRKVISVVGKADGVLILGPGQAKVVFKKTMDEERIPEQCVVVVETAQKMTPRRIVARVRNHFTGRSGRPTDDQP